MVRTRVKSPEYKVFLQFARTTFGSEVRPGHQAYPVEERAIKQLKSVLRASLNLELSDDDASHLLHLQPSRVAEPSRSKVYRHPDLVIDAIAACREDRRIHAREE